MPRCVDQIQNIGFTIFCLIMEPHRLCFNGDAAFALDIHRIEHLLFHFPLGKTTRHLDEPVSQS